MGKICAKWPIFGRGEGGGGNSKRIKNFDHIFWYMYLLTALNFCAKFERNRWFEYYHLLPGFLVGTLLNIRESGDGNL